MVCKSTLVIKLIHVHVCSLLYFVFTGRFLSSYGSVGVGWSGMAQGAIAVCAE